MKLQNVFKTLILIQLLNIMHVSICQECCPSKKHIYLEDSPSFYESGELVVNCWAVYSMERLFVVKYVRKHQIYMY